MKIIAFIEDDSTIQKILKHLGLWETRSHSPPPSSIICEEIGYVGESSTTSVPAQAHRYFLLRREGNRKGLSWKGAKSLPDA